MNPWQRFVADFSNTKVLILGLGLLGGGSGVTKVFGEAGAKLMISDKKSETELKSSLDEIAEYNPIIHAGAHDETDADWADVIIRNPSVPRNHPVLQRAKLSGKPIYMDAQLFLQYASLPSIGVTGTRGKTTTATMIKDIVAASGRQVLFGGNIAGTSMLSYLRKLHSLSNPIAVMELSSWQLQAFDEHHLSPAISVVTNLFPDHLNVYSSIHEYANDKMAIYRWQKPGDHVVLFKDIWEPNLWVKEVKSQLHWFTIADLPPKVTLTVPGPHNRANAAAAYLVAGILQIPSDIIVQTLEAFRGVPFRFETVRYLHGINFINDTTSTTPVATIAAINSCEKPPIIIVGGEDKKLPVDALITSLNLKVKHIILLRGSGTDRIKNSLSQHLVKGEYDTLYEAVMKAISLANDSDSIVFSPGFTSFGMFRNEFHRGEVFNQIVASLS